MNLYALKKCRLKIEENKSNTWIFIIDIDELATQSHTGYNNNWNSEDSKINHCNQKNKTISYNMFFTNRPYTSKIQ